MFQSFSSASHVLSRGHGHVCTALLCLRRYSLRIQSAECVELGNQLTCFMSSDSSMELFHETLSADASKFVLQQKPRYDQTSVVHIGAAFDDIVTKTGSELHMDYETEC